MIIGMDFGTTNSGMSVYDGRQLKLIPLDPHNANPYVARTALYITNDRSVYIGREATDTYYTQNLNRPFKLEQVRVGEIELTFAEIGTFIRDVYAERDVYAPGRLFVSFKMGLPSPHFLGTIIGAHYYFLEDIIALYLYVTRKRAEAFLNTPLDTIVLGRPVRYSENDEHNTLARERMLRAAFRAGYKTVYLQYEPIAAAYYYETTINREQNVLIFDFGGGTLDISIVRVGNPKTRAVLASGGIPIAGDVFDQKIVRAKLPPHFGEGDVYRAGRQELPVPSSYYEAFSNWQDLLSLQRPEKLEGLRKIEQNARRPQKIRALINLISSNYALKMFDMAEANKRQLSDRDRTLLAFDGPDFSIREMLTRAEFERMIRADVRAITARLDEVLAEAGLRPDQIDAVIRTGGSSQIPLFIDLLEGRFGAEKVREIDAFSSVTSGLGVIAHEIECGAASLQVYHADQQIAGEHLNSVAQGGVPVVDLNLMKRLVDLKEEQELSPDGAPDNGYVNEHGVQPLILVALDAAGRMTAVELPALEPDVEIGFKELPSIAAGDLLPPFALCRADERIVLMTTDYRCFVKTARELAELSAAGLVFETVEGFQADAFGAERLCAIVRRREIADAASALLISTTGYGRLLMGKPLLTRLDQPVPYQMNRFRGSPAALIDASPDRDLIIISAAGRAARITAKTLSSGDHRILQIPTSGGLIGALSINTAADLLIISASGLAKRITADAVPSAELNTNGTKIFTQANPVSALCIQPNAAVCALTNRRIITLLTDSIPRTSPDSSEAHKLLKLKKDERVLALFPIT